MGIINKEPSPRQYKVVLMASMGRKQSDIAKVTDYSKSAGSRILRRPSIAGALERQMEAFAQTARELAFCRIKDSKVGKVIQDYRALLEAENLSPEAQLELCNALEEHFLPMQRVKGKPRGRPFAKIKSDER